MTTPRVAPASKRDSVNAGSKRKKKTNGRAPEPKTRQEFAALITTAWQRSLRNVIKAGKWLLKAEVELKKRGEFTRMIELDLPFGERVAQRLMAIARHPVLSDPTHESGLPRSYITLYELSKLPPPEVKDLLEYNITIDTSRNEAEE